MSRELDLDKITFEYVSTCTNVKELQRIIRALENEPFDALLAAARQRLSEIKPAEAEAFAAATSAEIKEAHAEMGSWLNAAKAQDAELKKLSTAKLDLPPVRGSEASDKPKDKVKLSFKPPANAEVAKMVALREKEKGNESFRAKDFQEAVNYYSRSLQANNSDPAVLTNRALAYLKLKQYEKAEQDCSDALKLDTNNLKALLRRAQAFSGRFMHDRAVTDLRKCLEIEPTSKEAQGALEDALNKLGKTDPAAAAAEQQQATTKKKGKGKDKDKDKGKETKEGKQPRKVQIVEEVKEIKEKPQPKTTTTTSTTNTSKGTRMKIVESEDSDDEKHEKTPSATAAAKKTAPAPAPAKAAVSAPTAATNGKPAQLPSPSQTTTQTPAKAASPSASPTATATTPSTTATTSPMRKLKVVDEDSDEGTEKEKEKEKEKATEQSPAKPLPLPASIQALLSKAEDLKTQGNTHFKAGRLEEALTLYDQAIDAVTTQADAALAKEKPKMTTTHMETIEKRLGEMWVVCYSNRAHCHPSPGHERSIIDDCTAAIDARLKSGKQLPTHPNTAIRPKCLLRRGLALESLEKWADALDDFQSVMNLDRGGPLAEKARPPRDRLLKTLTKQIVQQMEECKAKGNDEFKAQRFKQAAELYGRGLAAFDRSLRGKEGDRKHDQLVFNLLTNRALACIRLGTTSDLRQAKSDCDRVMQDGQSAPAAELAKAQFRRGLACKGLGEWAAAVESLEEANKLQPRDETKTELARARSRLLTDTAERSLPADELRNPAMQGDPIIKSATTSSTTTKIKPNSPVQVVSDKPATASDEKEKEKAKPSPRAETKEKKEQPQQTQSPHKQPLPPPVSASVIFTAPKSLPEFERVYAEIRHDSDAVTRFFKAIDGKKFLSLFKSAGLSEEQLSVVCDVIVKEHKADPVWAFGMLSALPKTERFELNYMLASKEQVKALLNVFGFLFTDGVRTHGLQMDEVLSLQEKYKQ